MTLHNCDLCSNSTDFLPLPGDPSGKISICGQCGFVLVRERRNTEEVARAWDEIYASGGYDPNWPGVKARLFYVSDWIAQNIGLDGRSVLDIGAGNGLFLDYVRAHGADVFGLDPSQSNCLKLEAKDIAWYHLWAADSSPDIEKFDIVTLNWTLENTADCLEVLRYAKRQLKPDGHVVVATGSRIGVPFKKPLSSYIPQDPNYPHDTHCFRWSPNGLEGAFMAAGLWLRGRNDFDGRDEMICSFTGEMTFYSGNPAPPPSFPGDWVLRDDPKYVQDYFRRWQEQFP